MANPEHHENSEAVAVRDWREAQRMLADPGRGAHVAPDIASDAPIRERLSAVAARLRQLLPSFLRLIGVTSGAEQLGMQEHEPIAAEFPDEEILRLLRSNEWQTIQISGTEEPIGIWQKLLTRYHIIPEVTQMSSVQTRKNQNRITFTHPHVPNFLTHDQLLNLARHLTRWAQTIGVQIDFHQTEEDVLADRLVARFPNPEFIARVRAHKTTKAAQSAPSQTSGAQ